MIFRLRHLIWLLPLFVLVLVLALGALADSWLESSGGRKMLQRQLSESLGLPVRLDGDYSLRLLPRLSIAGRGLKIGQTAAQDAAVVSQKYSAAVDLAPLIHREIRIASIRLSGGYLDLSRLAGDGTMEKPRAATEMSLPQVGSLEIDDFSIRMSDGGKSLRILRLNIEGFGVGRETPVALQTVLTNESAEVARIKLDGVLFIGEQAFSPRLSIDRMTVSRGDSEMSGLEGGWSWDHERARLSGRMRWHPARGSAEMKLDMTMKPLPSGELSVDYSDSGQAGAASLALRFLVRPDVIDLKELDMNFAGQSIGGSGCLVMAETTTLNLSLTAGTLDLDRIRSALDLPEGEGGAMPMGLAIELRAEKAMMGGAEATDAVVTVGNQPVCPGPPASE